MHSIARQKSLTFPWQLSNSLTFPGFPDKCSPWCRWQTKHPQWWWWLTWRFTQSRSEIQHNLCNSLPTIIISLIRQVGSNKRKIQIKYKISRHNKLRPNGLYFIYFENDILRPSHHYVSLRIYPPTISGLLVEFNNILNGLTSLPQI